MTEKELKTLTDTFKDNIIALMPLIRCTTHFDVTCYREGWIILTLYNDLEDNRYMRQEIEFIDGKTNYKTTVHVREA